MLFSIGLIFNYEFMSFELLFEEKFDKEDIYKIILCLEIVKFIKFFDVIKKLFLRIVFRK